MEKNSCLKIKKKINNVSRKSNTSNLYYVYIIECENGILYTGVTTDYKRRLAEHMKIGGSKKGAKFTKSHKPLRIVALWITDNRSNAQKLESNIKKIDKLSKLNLINDNSLFKNYFDNALNIKLYKRKKINNLKK